MQVDERYGGIMLNTCCKEIWLNVIVTDGNIWYYIIKGLLQHANIVLLETSLVRTKLKGERMECNIGQDAIFLTHSELLYFL
jgi:hypothetical protein